MKILKKGIDKEKLPIKKICGYCKTKFEYDASDIQYDPRDGDYVICPLCKKFLAVGNQPQNIDRSTDC